MSLPNRLRELFPTKWSFFIFVAYMGLFINQGILVTATKENDNSYSYNSVTVVLLTEIFKLISSSLLFLHQHDWQLKVYVQEFLKDKQALLYYAVPSALYSVYNILTFTNLAAFDPTTYFLLLQLRVVVTGVVFQILFKKQLTARQWCSLLLLTVGCVIKQLYRLPPSEGKDWYQGLLNFNIILILVQVFCSCFAGVYNEYLLKHKAAHVDIMMQNVYMYVDSIACALLVMGARGELASSLTAESLRSVVLRPAVLAIAVNNACIGIVTSFFLRSLDSILKTFASALELMFTAVLSWLIFGIPVYANTAVAIAVVSAAIFLYSQQPVRNPMVKPAAPDAPAAAPRDVEAAQPLVEEE